MAAPFIQTSFATGEISPSLYGHTDLAKFHSSASTMRNMFVSYRGGAYSRAGTKLVGLSKQTGRSYPPRLIPFQFSINQGLVLEFGNYYMRVIQNGAYVLENSAFAITNITRATSGLVTTATAHGLQNGDWVNLSGVLGMLQANNIFVVQVVSTTTFYLYDAYGNAVNTSIYLPYTSGGSVSRIYTLATPWAEADLKWMKFVQSANTMSICCVNQISLQEYPPYDLVRGSANNSWSYAVMNPAASIAAPATMSANATVTTSSTPTTYQYCATAVSTSGQESQASSVAVVKNSVNIAATAGSLVMECAYVSGAAYYNFYKALPAYNVSYTPTGGLFGYVGQSYGTSFVDNNITANYAQVPPLHYNPFARNQIIGVTMTNAGSNVATATLSITSATGSGFTAYAVIDGTGAVTNFVITNNGSGYQASDTPVITVTYGSSGSSIAPTCTITVGPSSGTYPSVVGYFQSRRVYGNTINNPDTYFFSQPGNYTNFDFRTPTVSSDAITGTPWAQQVNGLQWYVSMPGGLVVLTGLGAWQLTGTGGSSLNPQAITPSTQQAQPQAYNGASATIPPIQIDYEILFVQSKGCIVRDFSYNFFSNIYTGTDLTQYSPHLFLNYTIKEWTYAEEPYKIIWAVRSDGTLLSLTFLKAQEIAGWARHDTLGTYQSVCSVVEPPVNAPYVCVQRFPNGQATYMIERMDNRLWPGIENAWCVDAGVSLTQGTRSATLTAAVNSLPGGGGLISAITNLSSGSGYSPGTTATVVDQNGNGPGYGAVLSVNIIAGTIASITVVSQGQNYVNPSIIISDPNNTGSGASAKAVLANYVVLNASAVNTFASTDVGSVIRFNGGTMVVTSVPSSSQVWANVVSPMTNYIPGNAGTPGYTSTNVLIYPYIPPAAAGSWTITKPVSTIYGLQHLAGQVVTGLADGNIIPYTQVGADGSLVLPAAASSVTVGLGFQAQLQSVYLDIPQGNLQGQRKLILAVTARLEASGPPAIGTNQPDGAAQCPPIIGPYWANMTQVALNALTSPLGTLIVPYPLTVAGLAGGTPTPLYSGDVRLPVTSSYDNRGQVAIQQSYPLPLQVSALIPEFFTADMPEMMFPGKKK
jgi:hypothetical protein